MILKIWNTHLKFHPWNMLRNGNILLDNMVGFITKTIEKIAKLKELKWKKKISLFYTKKKVFHFLFCFFLKKIKFYFIRTCDVHFIYFLNFHINCFPSIFVQVYMYDYIFFAFKYMTFLFIYIFSDIWYYIQRILIFFVVYYIFLIL